jgi:hypothetical protein
MRSLSCWRGGSTRDVPYSQDVGRHTSLFIGDESGWYPEIKEAREGGVRRMINGWKAQEGKEDPTHTRAGQ